MQNRIANIIITIFFSYYLMVNAGCVRHIFQEVDVKNTSI